MRNKGSLLYKEYHSKKNNGHLVDFFFWVSVANLSILIWFYSRFFYLFLKNKHIVNLVS